MFNISLLVLFNFILFVNSYKILGLFPHPGKSHVDVFLPLMKGLSMKGHEVTVISYFPLKTPIPRYEDIAINNELGGLLNIFDLNSFTGSIIERFSHVLVLSQLGKSACEMSLSSEPVQGFLKQNNSYDVIIAEFFNTDCFLGFVHKFKAPLIGVSSSAIMPWTGRRFGNPTHPAYIPNIMSTYSDRLTFFGRVENVLLGLYQQIFFDIITNGNDEIIARKHFGNELPLLRNIALNSSLLFMNTHFSLNLPRPLVPAIIQIAGIHIEKKKQLPKNIEKWINESTHGVIYFSLGSMIKGHTFPEEKRQAFLKAFERLPQRVLWKWENDTMPGKPENVMIQKWMPQFDILSHPNVKAFISHGGLLGTIETVHCGVPALVMPQYGDQYTNARALEANGGGIILQLRDVDEEKIYNGLKTILSPEFRKKAQELSTRFKDRPLPPLETAIYWVEYVARHRGAHHMRTAAVGMPFYKYFLLDVIAFLLAIFSIISAIIFYVTRALLKQLFRKSNKRKTN